MLNDYVKKFVITVGGIAILSVFFFIFLYIYGGLRENIKAIVYMSFESNTPADWENFQGTDTNQIYGGILANRSNFGIWVWGRGIIRYFPIDANSTFTFYDGCNSTYLDAIKSGKAPDSLAKEVYFSSPDWGKKIHTGDYVVVYYTNNFIPKIKEAWGYNFWAFKSGSLESQCLNQ